MSEILALEWSWIDFENRRVVWPDSKTGGISKPLSQEAIRLLMALTAHKTVQMFTFQTP